MPDATSIQAWHQLLSDMLVYGSPIFIVLLFRGLLEEVVSGLLWRFGSHLDEDDIVKFNGQWGRIARIGIFKTVLYIYELDKQRRIVGGYSLCLLNSELRKMQISEPLKLIETQITLKPIDR